MMTRNAFFPGPQPKPFALAKNPRERTRGEQLLAEIEAFIQRNPRWTFCEFGRRAIGNPKLADNLRNGLDPQEITCRRVRKFIAENGG